MWWKNIKVMVLMGCLAVVCMSVPELVAVTIDLYAEFSNSLTHYFEF
jgi:hypothetical protein